MSGYRHIIYVIVSILLLNASNLFAKVYWLPDYLGDNTNRSNGVEDDHRGGIVDNERGCPNGWLSTAQKGDMTCDLMGSYPWVGNCFSNCKCKLDKYPYTTDNCSGTKAPSGDECNDGTIHYKECIDACDLVEGLSCSYGCQTTFEAEGCASECKVCYTDNCHNRTSVEPCDYGCESYFSDCSSKCEKCYADNCRNRTDNATDLGCDSYWQDCSSKCEVGKTCVPTDCSAYTLTSCPANATCTNCTVGCGDSTVKYKVTKCSLGYYLQNGECTKIDGVIGLRYNVTAANGSVSLTTGKSGYASESFTVDWGDGTVESYNGNTSVSHTYTETGDFDVVLSGTIKHFATSTSTNANITHLLSLNLPSVLSYYSAFSSKSTIISTIPALPTNLKDASLMFYSCKGLTGSIPNLPSTITSALRMFDGCNHLTGTIPTLPSSLVDATEMFESCVSLSGTLNNTNLANTKIKYADSMFMHCRNLKGSIPALPQTLIEADRMFYNCNSLTGSIPALPTSIKTAGFMFYYCYSLTGNIPTLPPQLSTGSSMFENCTGLTGSIPSLPSTLKYGDWMFLGCTGLTGNIPTLPSVLYDARQMFLDCTGLTGNVPTLPESLRKAENMFRDCNLSGTAPAKPSNLNSYTAMFRGTTVTNDGSWPDSAW